MAHDPSLGFADYFSAADATAASVAALMPAMDEGAPELFGLQAGMELLGMRGLAAMTGTTSVAASAAHSKAVLVDAGGDGSTMRFLSGHHHHQHHQPSQAPLSLSLCRPEDVLHQHLGVGGSSRQQPTAAAWMHDSSAPHGHGAWHLRRSRFLLPAQQLLQEFCSLPVDSTKRTKAPRPPQREEGGDGAGGSSSSTSWTPQIQAMDALELQRLKDKLYIMLEEVDRRYRRYCEQMRGLAGGFEAVAGERAAAAYTALASRTISRHFRNLRDGIVGQLQAVRRALGEKDVTAPGMTRGETPRLRVLDQSIRQQKALHQAGMMDSHPWRPQRGLPERAVTILRAWLFEHFLHPYPSDVDKHILARQTGLSRSQVSNWFINARVRLWKPMVEEMYVEEMKDQDGGSGGGQGSLNPNPSSHASDGQLRIDRGDGDGGDQKPTRAQLLHDSGSLASVVNIGSVARAGARMENLGIMDHLGFDAYDSQGGFDTGGGGVSLTLGLQQHDGGAGFLFPAGEQMDGVHSGHGHHAQFGAGMDGEAAHGQEHYRGLNAGFHLLRDLAG